MIGIFLLMAIFISMAPTPEYPTEEKLNPIIVTPSDGNESQSRSERRMICRCQSIDSEAELSLLKADDERH